MEERKYLERYNGALIDPFLDHAKVLAYLLSREKNVSLVALTGSLARSEDARDIDLVVLHTLGADKDFTCHINHNPSGFDLTHRTESRDSVLTHLCDQTMRQLGWCGFIEDNFSLGLLSIIRKLCMGVPVRPKDIKVDLIFVGYQVLYDCDYLARLAGIEKFEDFYRRVFCEIPLLRFNPAVAQFEYPSLRHKDGKCCFPRRLWKDVRREVKSEFDWMANS
ncbi:MAG: hypothetical protein A2934_01570 [Candidatus Sungbacteria bacterium RIFCSPLOWO2_01_FULL_47_10]|uniref:Uncharacterized protein n=1 Tax=Candidatus Sungbacteria bacterium RIFCSPLOWO2_01_FULL_47_10 TaxID=1802276 RepID=A0A1G2L7A1_9BACT|nr:MAG: hypothetical protein A2934_01570 [Candidatus Sungbacteria bacterium RIFCSPLOWO2_01_FULL_47_10]